MGLTNMPIWPGLDRAAELEAFRRESRRRAQERRESLMALLNEETNATERAWNSVNETYERRANILYGKK